MARLGEAVVVLLVGLLLTPVGAVLGSVLFFSVGLALFADHPFQRRDMRSAGRDARR